MAEKLYYSMGEVAEMLCVSPSLVRFWEKRFDIIVPHKNKKGNRLFSPDDVRNLKTIYHLVKERGMTLAGAEKHLKAGRSGVERDMEIAERLASIRALLVEVREELGSNHGLRILQEVEEDEETVEVTKTTKETKVVEREVIETVGEMAVVEKAVNSEPTAPETKPNYIEQTLF